MSLWSFAETLYSRPGVEPALLSLQDEHGQCVSLLIWRLWALSERRPIDAALLAVALAAAADWDRAAVSPLRGVRRGLKSALPLIAQAARLRLRETVKAAELDAERALLESLEALSPPPQREAEDPVAALLELASAWGAPPPAEVLRRLTEIAL